ncbi:MAG: HepT-like ribonuclease domain-containing protein [Polaromonas sp.]
MQRDPRAWLWDVREAAEAVKHFVAGLDANSYARTPLVYSAVERKFEIIGEALNQLAKAKPELAARIPHLAQIVAFRNQLIHGYARVDHDTVWDVIQQSLPALATVVDELLQELEQS